MLLITAKHLSFKKLCAVGQNSKIRAQKHVLLNSFSYFNVIPLYFRISMRGRVLERSTSDHETDYDKRLTVRICVSYISFINISFALRKQR